MIGILTGEVTSLDWSTALTGIGQFISQGFTFMTQEPMVYFLAFGLLASGIGIFARAKSAAK